MHFQIKVELKSIQSPLIWRRFRIPVHYNFHEFHLVIQAAMGWRDSHLYCFSENGINDLFKIVSPYDEENGIDARYVPINLILLSAFNSGVMDTPRKKITYIYDYGDSWLHELDVEAVLSENSKKAELLEGAGACPPEDCGGTPGYMDLLSSLKTGKVSGFHGESWMPWLNQNGYQKFDPEQFNLEKARKQVRKI